MRKRKQKEKKVRGIMFEELKVDRKLMKSGIILLLFGKSE